MKISRTSGALGMLTLISACAVHINDGTTTPAPRHASAPPPRPAAAPPPPAPAPPPPAQVAAHPGIGKPGAAPAPAPAAPAHGGAAALRAYAHVSPVPVIQEALNVRYLQTVAQRAPKPCGPMQVSPGNWVKVDCHTYTPVTKATFHTSARKLGVIKARAGTFQRRGPGAAGAAAPGGGERAGGPRPGDPAARGTNESFPDTVDHRNDGTEGPIKNQGMVGACTAFSLSSVLDNGLWRANRHEATSPTHVWSHYGIPQMSTAGDANLGKSITTYTLWSYSQKEACQIMAEADEDCSEGLGTKAGTLRNDPAFLKKVADSDAAGTAKVGSIEKLADPVDVDEIVSVLAGGADVWIAMYVTFPEWSNSSMANFVIPDWTNRSGGHAIVMSGYRTTPSGRQFLIHNSWGVSWGDQGYAWISEAMVKRQLKYAYRVKLGDGVKPVELSDSDCSDNELLDSVLGICAQMCMDESQDPRPANNVCLAFGSTGGGAPTRATPPPPPPPPPPSHGFIKPRH